jgi:peptidoglycan/xylan/chitin deacetylase (PgdA/CDA1 family)
MRSAGNLSDSLVLCYHALSEDWPAALSTTPARFAAQLRLLKRRGYRAVTFSELVAGSDEGKRVAITFDDGYKSVGRLAKPLLDEVGYSATVFVPTDMVGWAGPVAWPGVDRWLGGPYEQELIPHTWDELRALADDGWEIGSHTRSHPHLTTLDDERLRAELHGSRRRCEDELGRRCTSIAYPYGDYDARVSAAAERAGYEAGASLALTPPRPLEWPRVGVYNIDAGWRYRLKVSPPLRRLRSKSG